MRILLLSVVIALPVAHAQFFPIGGATEVTQLANHAELVTQIEKQLQHISIALNTYNQIMTAGRLLTNLQWSNAQQDLMNLASIVQVGSGLAFSLAALDAQLQLTREESPELKEAFAKITELADALAREREITAELRGQIDDLLLAGNETAPSPHIMAAPRGSDGLMNGGLVAAVSVVAVALMIAAAFQ